MIVNGKALADKILENLKSSILNAQYFNPPTLAVILVGNNPASISYVKQKQKAADQIGAKLILKEFPDTIDQISLISQISLINADPQIDALIVQRPLPQHINKIKIASAILPEKDVDGFNPKSKFTPPVALAVLKVLEYIYSVIANPSFSEKRGGRQSTHFQSSLSSQSVTNQPATRRSRTIVRDSQLANWLTTQNILILGKGETGGKPIADMFKKLDIKYQQADSKTVNTAGLLINADIVISAVGKPNFITGSMIKKGAICIGIGISRLTIKQSNNETIDKLIGDFEEESVSKVAGFYTPTPGGVGPINVACLMENLINS